MNSTEKLTNEILTHHLTAFGQNNLDEIMKDYTEDSKVLTAKGVLKNLESIRLFFADFFALIPTGSAFEMKQLNIVDNVAHIIWSSKSSLAEITLGTDTFVMEGNKIKYHTVAS